MHVAFINENTLGHSSYLLPFVRTLEQRADHGVTPHVINATPLPPGLRRRADVTVPLLRRWGLDFHNLRWRLTVSRHVRDELQRLRATQRIDAVVVNTQSIALSLNEIAAGLPVFVCLDATFSQLSRTPWFAPNAISRALLPITTGPLRARERIILQRAKKVFPWSCAALRSLERDYGISVTRLDLLPPSIDLGKFQPRPAPENSRKQILFVGGDFRRKGGPLLLSCFRRHFAQEHDLHLVTQSDVAAERAVFVHHGVVAGSDAWRRRWQEADVFVFPSQLETFGIVLLEALAFGVPVISSDCGAAQEILSGGKGGMILSALAEEHVRNAIETVFGHPEEAQARAAIGRQTMKMHYDLEQNTAKLAQSLKEAAHA